MEAPWGLMIKASTSPNFFSDCNNAAAIALLK
jgi:hypothetical protein